MLVATTVAVVQVVVAAAQVSTQTVATESVAGAGVVSGATLSQAVKTKANNAIPTKVKIEFFILSIHRYKKDKSQDNSRLFVIK